MTHARPYLLDETASYARRSNGSVLLVLRMSLDEPLDVPEARLRFSDGERQVRTRARLRRTGESVVVLEADVPAARLTPGTWRLALRPGPDESWTPLQARLLVPSPGQPVALLPGPEPRTRMAPPAPAGGGRRRGTGGVVAALAGLAGRGRSLAGRVRGRLAGRTARLRGHEPQ